MVMVGVSYAAPERDPSLAYIEKYSSVAISEMYRSGVPASITLAQGLLESRSGRSDLAVKGNNHFGIKCHDWKGPRMSFDDDAKGECFRKYAHPEASFKDHSDFLRYRDRYKFLFDLETSDYKGWAYGLKKAGYATDPKYPQKLISLIERYDLSRFDTASEDSGAYGGQDGKHQGQSSRKDRNGKVKKGKNRIPESPNVLEHPVPVEKGRFEEFKFSLSRQLFSQNKVPFVYSVEGETYGSIARHYDLFLGEILRFNDVDKDKPLPPGSIVYLQAKKNRAAKYVDKYIADGNETLWEISQRFGVKLKKILEINGLSESYIPRPEDTILLRK